MKFPLGGINADFDSKASRAKVVNFIPEADNKGNYRTVRKAHGLKDFSSWTGDPVRSDLLVNSGFIYFVAGLLLYRCTKGGVSTSLGSVGGIGRAKLSANALPGDSQILVLNGSGVGYIYTNTDGLSQITDADFFPSSSVGVLDERFWLARDGTNEFFGSELSDGKTYNALTFDLADESPDNVVAVMPVRSALWVLNEDSTEYWQAFTDVTFPLRRVKGASHGYGILAKDSLAEVNKIYCFLASDLTVKMVTGDQIKTISDLDFDTKVAGSDPDTSPGFNTVNNAFGFFADGPTHTTYYLTFPSEGFTWAYDLKTGLSHIRSSTGVGFWRANGAVKFNGQVVCGDSQKPKLSLLTKAVTQEVGENFTSTLVTPFYINHDRHVTIDLIIIDAEMAVDTNPANEPMLTVSYTKDGGETWTSKAPISLGKTGQYKKKIHLRKFGRLSRGHYFGLRIEAAGDFNVQFYGATANIGVSI